MGTGMREERIKLKRDTRKGKLGKKKQGDRERERERENSDTGGRLTALSSAATIQTRALLVYIDPRSPALFGLGSVHALLDIGCQAIECLFDVDVVLCGDLQEGNAEFVSKLLALLGGNGPLLLPVTLVSDENLVHSFAGVLFDIREPGSDVCSGKKQRVRSCYILG